MSFLAVSGEPQLALAGFSPIPACGPHMSEAALVLNPPHAWNPASSSAASISDSSNSPRKFSAVKGSCD